MLGMVIAARFDRSAVLQSGDGPVLCIIWSVCVEEAVADPARLADAVLNLCELVSSDSRGTITWSTA